MISKEDITRTLLVHFLQGTPRQPYSASYYSTLFPVGKLFRPCLVWSLFFDLSKSTDEIDHPHPHSHSHSHSLLASSIEFHHLYTLIHDDLPSMDNASERRGRKACHIQYNEWTALLTGDGFLNLSYQLLSQIHSVHLNKLLSFFCWSVGPKGLVMGQYLDLSYKKKFNFNNLLRIYELKTGRLMQVCLVGSYLLLNRDLTKTNKNIIKNLFKIGSYLGIIFQLLDDLTEFLKQKISDHEQEINPWPQSSDLCYEYLIKYIHKLHTLIQDLRLLQVHKAVCDHFYRTMMMIEKNEQKIFIHVKADLKPLLALLKHFHSIS